MGYAVLHTEKGNLSPGGIGKHIDREVGAEHAYQHANPALRDKNQHYELNDYCKMPLHKAIEERIKDGYKSDKAIRKDAVKYCTHILSGSHEEMKAIFQDEKKSSAWVMANKRFIEQEFGEKNIVRFTLHLDEKTPHIHVVTVPITSDGRLSAKEMIGNRKDMQDRQDRYALAMQQFGLERGMRNSPARHESAKEYHTRINEGLKPKFEIKPEKNMLGVYTENSLSKTLKQVEVYNSTINELKSREIKKNEQIKRLQAVAEVLRKEVELIKSEKKNLLIDPERYTQEKARFDRITLHHLKYCLYPERNGFELSYPQARKSTGLEFKQIKTYLDQNPEIAKKLAEEIIKKNNRGNSLENDFKIG